LDHWLVSTVIVYSYLISFYFKGKSKVFLKYYHAEQLTRLYTDMMRAIVTIQSYVRMRLVRARLKQRQYKHSNDMIIQELHRHPKFSRVSCEFVLEN
jgi:hypothetical protein